MRASYSALAHGIGRKTGHTGRPAAAACASTSDRRTACIATRSTASLKVVSRPTISVFGSWRSRCSVQALSLPELHESSTRRVRGDSREVIRSALQSLVEEQLPISLRQIVDVARRRETEDAV